MTVDVAFSTPVDAYSRPRARPAFPSLVPMDEVDVHLQLYVGTVQKRRVPVLCLCCAYAVPVNLFVCQVTLPSHLACERLVFAARRCVTLTDDQSENSSQCQLLSNRR